MLVVLLICSCFSYRHTCTQTHTDNMESVAPCSPRFNTVKGFGFIEPLGEATAILEGKAAWAFDGSDGVPHRSKELNTVIVIMHLDEKMGEYMTTGGATVHP